MRCCTAAQTLNSCEQVLKRNSTKLKTEINRFQSSPMWHSMFFPVHQGHNSWEKQNKPIRLFLKCTRTRLFTWHNSWYLYLQLQRCNASVGVNSQSFQETDPLIEFKVLHSRETTFDTTSFAKLIISQSSALHNRLLRDIGSLLRCIKPLSPWDIRKKTTLTSVWPPTDFILGSSPDPSIIIVRFGCNFPFVDCKAHLVNSVNSPIRTMPALINVGATVNQRQCLGVDVQRQALGCGHMEESVTRTPLPQLGPAVWVAGGEVQVCWIPCSQALLWARVLNGESILVCDDGTDAKV